MKHLIYNRYPLGNKRFKWRQKDYVLSNFAAIGSVVMGDPAEVLDKNIASLKEAGFNMTELGWACHEGAWAAIDACEKHGLDLVFQDMSIMGGMQFRFLENKVPFEVVKELVKYARIREKESGKNFRFTLTTNGVLIDDEVIDFCNKEMHTALRESYEYMISNNFANGNK